MNTEKIKHQRVTFKGYLLLEEDLIAVDEQSETVNVTGEMKDYVSAISRTIK